MNLFLTFLLRMTSGLCFRLKNLCFTVYTSNRTILSELFSTLHAGNGFTIYACCCQAHHWKTRDKEWPRPCCCTGIRDPFQVHLRMLLFHLGMLNDNR